MKVRLTRDTFVGVTTRKKGDVVDYRRDVAQRLIKAGVVVPVDPAEAAAASSTENADASQAGSGSDDDENVDNSPTDYFIDLGLDPRNAANLVANGIESVEQLREKAGELEQLTGFGKATAASVRAWLQGLATPNQAATDPPTDPRADSPSDEPNTDDPAIDLG